MIKMFIKRTLSTLRIFTVLDQQQLKHQQSIISSQLLSMYLNPNIMQRKNVQVIDLRSDTLTKPSSLMRKAMFEAEVGDDVYQEDPTVKALEEKAALMLGKESALFIPSGTMGNLIAIMAHCNQRGCEVIVGDATHTFLYEQGGAAQIAGVQLSTLPNKPDGTFCLEEMVNKVRGDDDHEPTTSLIIVENTHNMCGGKVLPLEWLDKLAQLAKKRHIPLHMDGARIFNAAIHLNVSASRIVRDFASVTFCLSKGLGAPVGSVLAGDADFIRKSRRLRKALGGGMRQAGILAAAGLISLDHMINRLAEDHFRAAKIARAIANFHSKYISVDLENLHTNILLINTDVNKITAEDFCKRLASITEEEMAKLGSNTIIIKINPKSVDCARFVTYYEISDENINAVICKLQYVMQELEENKL